IIWAADHGAKVINLSLGGPSPSPGTETAIRYANGKGAVVVVAAGNEAEVGNAASYPAAYPEAVAVGAVQQDLSRAPYSDYGSYVDVAAPGSDILSTWHTNDDSYEYASGTSMAAPYASAAAALEFGANEHLSVTAATTCLEGTAHDLGTPGVDPSFGHGLFDPQLAVGCALASGGGAGAHGYWTVDSTGHVSAYGTARADGDPQGRALGTVVASAAMPNGAGYWVTTNTGAVYAYGAAHFEGSLTGRALSQSIVGMSATPSGHGYYL